MYLMKILIAYSKTFLKKLSGNDKIISDTLKFAEYLSQYCNVICVDVDESKNGIFDEKRIIEKFLPDIIHCADSESFSVFRYFRKIMYSVPPEKKSEEKKSALKHSSLCAFSNESTMFKTCSETKECAAIVIPKDMQMRQYIKTYLFYYYQILLHSNSELYAAYNLSANINYRKIRSILETKQTYLNETQKIAEYFYRLPFSKVKKMKARNILIISDFPIEKNIKKQLTSTFCRIEFINILQFMRNYLFFPNECLPFFDKSYEYVFLCTSFERKEDKKMVNSELNRISAIFFLKLSEQIIKIE